MNEETMNKMLAKQKKMAQDMYKKMKKLSAKATQQDDALRKDIGEMREVIGDLHSMVFPLSIAVYSLVLLLIDKEIVTTEEMNQYATAYVNETLDDSYQGSFKGIKFIK